MKRSHFAVHVAMEGGSRKRKGKQEREEPAQEEGRVENDLQSLDTPILLPFPHTFSCSSSKEEVQKGQTCVIDP